MFTDTEQPLTVPDKSILLGREQEEAKRLMLLQVRVKGVILALAAHSGTDHLPVPLLVFMQNLIKPGAYVPDQFLTRYQLNRIDTDNYGAL
jgi:hypothetical protein